MNGLSAVTATVGVIALITALVIATVGRMQWPRLTAALVLTGTAGILNSTIGPNIRSVVTMLDGHVGQFIGRWTGTAVMGVIGMTVLGATAFWVFQRRIDMRTLAASAAVPLTVTLIPGTLGTLATAVVGVVPWIVGGLIAFLFGIG